MQSRLGALDDPKGFDLTVGVPGKCQNRSRERLWDYDLIVDVIV
jgi:hypothetical protein